MSPDDRAPDGDPHGRFPGETLSHSAATSWVIPTPQRSHSSARSWGNLTRRRSYNDTPGNPFAHPGIKRPPCANTTAICCIFQAVYPRIFYMAQKLQIIILLCQMIATIFFPSVWPMWIPDVQFHVLSCKKSVKIGAWSGKIWEMSGNFIAYDLWEPWFFTDEVQYTSFTDAGAPNSLPRTSAGLSHIPKAAICFGHKTL